jgi:hypothetical protein
VGTPPTMAVHYRVADSAQYEKIDAITRCTKGGGKPDVRWGYAGSRLKPIRTLGRRHLKGRPFSRTGENPPYGMLGRIVETSASYEAWSAPRFYPTEGGGSAARLSCLILPYSAPRFALGKR